MYISILLKKILVFTIHDDDSIPKVFTHKRKLRKREIEKRPTLVHLYSSQTLTISRFYLLQTQGLSNVVSFEKPYKSLFLHFKITQNRQYITLCYDLHHTFCYDKMTLSFIIISVPLQWSPTVVSLHRRRSRTDTPVLLTQTTQSLLTRLRPYNVFNLTKPTLIVH